MMWLLAQAASAVGVPTEGSGEPPQVDFGMLWEQYNGSTILTVAGVVVALWLVAQIVQNIRSVSTYGAGMDRRVRRRVRELEVAGNFVAAGDLLFQGEAYEDAAELYLKSDEFLRAGEAMEKAGNIPRAAQLYRRGGAVVMAAEAYRRRGQFSLAAKEYAAAGAMDKAAEAFQKANDFRGAAELYMKLDRLQDAGEAWLRAGEKGRAAAVWRRYFDQQLELSRGDLGRIRDACELAVRAADLLVETGEKDEAAGLLHRAGSLKRAAELYTELGRIEDAAAVYIAARRPALAARLYESVGDREKALQYRAEARLQSNDSAGAAEDFAAAGEFVKAAELLQAAGEYGRAAEMFDRGGEPRLAGELYKTDGNLPAAAAAFERAGDFLQAADIYGQLGDHNAEVRAAKAASDWYRVGDILLRFQRLEDALAAFQRVEPLDARHEAAVILQADILRTLKRYDVALRKYEEVLKEQRPSQANVELFYRMAGVAMEAGQLREALALYEGIIGVNYYFKDANQIAADLRQRLGTPTSGFVGPVAGTGIRQPTLNSAEALTRAQGSKRYQVEEEVARGGMGVVYKARDLVLDRIVAYKILSTNLKENEVAVKYFLREARAAAQMAHPNIVTVYDAGEQDGEFYMAMEFVEGHTLKALITRQGAFPEKLVRYIMAQVCKGLQYAHERGLVHRDIKPGNIMLTRDRTLKLMDFGLAKFVEEVQANHTRAIGTPYYMSPEQVLGKELDGRSDIYSLGVSIFECATGQVPFSKGDLSYHHLHTEAPDPRTLNPKVSDELAGIILRCMAKEPADRYSTVGELLQVIKG
jgi:tetratricopeptide (TPR) repeat protein